MQQWEYLDVYVNTETAVWTDNRGRSETPPWIGGERRERGKGFYSFAPTMNDLGSQGWELVNVVPVAFGFVLYLKRPKQQWEYMTWIFGEYHGDDIATSINGEMQPDPLLLSEALSKVGADGWELVSTHSTGEDWQAMSRATYVFKHPKQ